MSGSTKAAGSTHAFAVQTGLLALRTLAGAALPALSAGALAHDAGAAVWRQEDGDAAQRCQIQATAAASRVARAVLKLDSGRLTPPVYYEEES